MPLSAYVGRAMSNHPTPSPEKAPVSSPSSKRITNPTGSRIAALARTFPPRFPRHRFFGHGFKPTADEWVRMQEHFARFPDDRIVRGEQHMAGENRYFISYHKNFPNGERWGTKEDLVEVRKAANAANRRQHKKLMATDPAYKAAKLDKLRSLVDRQVAIREEMGERTQAQKEKHAIRQRKFAAAEKTRASKALADAQKKAQKGRSLSREEKAAVARAELDAKRAAIRAEVIEFEERQKAAAQAA